MNIDDSWLCPARMYFPSTFPTEKHSLWDRHSTHTGKLWLLATGTDHYGNHTD